MFDRLIQKLERFTPLSSHDKRTLEAAPFRVQEYRRHEDIVQQGQRVAESCLILEGLAGRFKILPEGTRQILSFELPGDFADLHSIYLKTMDHGLQTLAPCRVAMFPHAAIMEIMNARPNLDLAFSYDLAVDAAIQREWMIGMGRRSAYQQTAHLLCELLMRLRSVGLARDDGYDLPVTQADLGDVFGIPTVHVNRTLQKLRSEGLITLKGGALTIPDLGALKEAAGFDPTYLEWTGVGTSGAQ